MSLLNQVCDKNPNYIVSANNSGLVIDVKEMSGEWLIGDLSGCQID